MSPGARLGGSSLTSTDEHAVVLSGRSSPVLNSVAQLQLSGECDVHALAGGGAWVLVWVWVWVSEGVYERKVKGCMREK
eukprot:1154556-Pelagomonas_calceolata.AAC.1